MNKTGIYDVAGFKKCLAAGEARGKRKVLMWKRQVHHCNVETQQHEPGLTELNLTLTFQESCGLENDGEYLMRRIGRAFIGGINTVARESSF